MIIQHNMQSMNANRQLGVVGKNLSKSAEKLSSGYRINRAADDAAGLAISEKMRSQVRGLQRASANAQDGISMIQTAEGAMEQQHAILQRARELVVQASNTAVLDSGTADYSKIQVELNELKKEFSQITATTQFNKKMLLNGSMMRAWLQVGANSTQGIRVSVTKVLWGGVSLNTVGGSPMDGSAISLALSYMDATIQQVSEKRSYLGAIQNRLEYRIKVDDNAAENLQSAESTIRDTNMADEMTRYSKESILQQAATSMLAQANQAKQGVLSLLG